ncbi:hypothetical protein ACFPVT_00765 [Corynebacterium choanae]|uniref:Uncharacterized protein n=1 Tax=Corynebacterium choanae TaxID=1862358 RepID=A0A3G6J654_9CORY|nr:hypothetical protein [Corynebacterium choanae]AZA13253.1 hypothetical protein CCHOA_04220 [Corynebacterium choanae]
MGLTLYTVVVVAGLLFALLLCGCATWWLLRMVPITAPYSTKDEHASVIAARTVANLYAVGDGDPTQVTFHRQWRGYEPEAVGQLVTALCTCPVHGQSVGDTVPAPALTAAAPEACVCCDEHWKPSKLPRAAVGVNTAEVAALVDRVAETASRNLSTKPPLS